MFQKFIEIFKPNFDEPSSLNRHYMEGEISGAVAKHGAAGTGKFKRSNNGRNQGQHRAELEVCIPPPQGGTAASL